MNVRCLADRSSSPARYDVTTYFYENSTYPYRITRIEDPRHISRTRFEYSPDGKLEKIIHRVAPKPASSTTSWQ
jgi:hypothetical protein